MNRPTPFRMAPILAPNLISQSPLRRRFSVVLLACAFTFALSPMARAVNPPPDGGYPGYNTAEGDGALQSVTPDPNTSRGFENTAVGFDALFSNTIGSSNIATGFQALFSNTTGSANTATGVDALYANTSGSNNTATGASALSANTANANTANGAYALLNNTIGIQNTAAGFQALFSNTTGNHNTAHGVNALQHNTTGNLDTATGQGALSQLTTGSSNTATGQSALRQLTTGSSNIALGVNAGANLTTGSENIEIGNNVGATGDANTIRIGKVGTQNATFVAGIYGSTLANGVGVIVAPNGRLGTVLSSAWFKEAIKPMDKTSEAIFALQPVTFRYKPELDPDGIPQFGLVAEQVEKVNPDLVVRDQDGKVNTVRYEAVNAMLLNEFLKEHRNVAEQQSTIAELKAALARQQATNAQQQQQIEALAAGLQKVSAAVELNKSAPTQVADTR
jgi:uncharacterized coiled-coil protein SlyX